MGQDDGMNHYTNEFNRARARVERLRIELAAAQWALDAIELAEAQHPRLTGRHSIDQDVNLLAQK